MVNLGFTAGVDEQGRGRIASHFLINVPLFRCLLNLVVTSGGLTSETVPLLAILLSRIRLRESPTKHTHFLAKVKCVHSEPAVCWRKYNSYESTHASLLLWS